jgi:hypothetical protein
MPATHLPFWHKSTLVQALLSVQLPVALTWPHVPLALSQLSLVQGLPSSQFNALPAAQVPAAQMSPLVQALLSLQGPVLAGKLHFLFTHVSSVHGLPSLQALASVQLPPQPTMGAKMHKLLLASQLSAVQVSPSLHALAVPDTHDPAAHLSPLVHALPSSQVALLAV